MLKDLRELFAMIPPEHRGNIIGGVVYFLVVILGLAMTYPEWFR